ncbi:MAG: energy-coupling factor transporter transmembrane protein EcfT, partial [Lachnospiraceae bacterium]|nr:energy-coupling factor transporter transmembrane protein EcfT [Lachnospiraceae bacterium]
MIRDITLGQYYRAESVVHRLDPRVKILGTLMYMVSLFTLQRMSGYLIAISFFAFVLFLSKVPFLYTVRGLRPIFIMLIFTAFLNLFWTEGTVLYQIGILKITKEGL